MTLLILFFSVSILFSFLCSILEAVLLSITPAFIRKQQKERPLLFADLNRFKEDIDRPLSAILTLNTIAHTVGAIGVGAQAAVVFADSKMAIAGLSISIESIIATVMTLAILILSEIIPKTIGANNWEALTPFTVRSLKLLIRVLSPLVWLSQQITRGLKNQKDKAVLGRSDLLAMADAVSSEGEIHPSESRVIQNVLNLPKKTIHDIMTPRNVMFTALASDPLKSLNEDERFQQFSRIPLFATADRADIVGMVLKQDVLAKMIDGEGEIAMEQIMRPVSFVSEELLLGDFFKQTYQKREHLYIVLDNYKSVVGVVSLEDVLETILGYEIMDETDTVEDLQKLSR